MPWVLRDFCLPQHATVLDKTAIKLSIHSSSSGNSSTVYHMLTKLVANQNRHPLLAFLW